MRLLGDEGIDDSTKQSRAAPTPKVDRPQLGVDGPVGAPAQGYEQFRTVILVGAGIGVTPFASILRDLAHRMDASRCPHCAKATSLAGGDVFKTRRVHFYFVCRTPEEATWFAGTIDDVVGELDTGVIDINIHVTRAVVQEDVRSALLAIGQKLMLEREGRDVVTGMSVRTRFGRPVWADEFRHVADENPFTKVGVFACAPPPLIEELRRNCIEFSEAGAASGGTRFLLKAEVFS